MDMAFTDTHWIKFGKQCNFIWITNNSVVTLSLLEWTWTCTDTPNAGKNSITSPTSFYSIWYILLAWAKNTERKKNSTNNNGVQSYLVIIVYLYQNDCTLHTHIHGVLMRVDGVSHKTTNQNQSKKNEHVELSIHAHHINKANGFFNHSIPTTIAALMRSVVDALE